MRSSTVDTYSIHYMPHTQISLHSKFGSTSSGLDAEVLQLVILNISGSAEEHCVATISHIFTSNQSLRASNLHCCTLVLTETERRLIGMN